jgi:hypothetical protein
MTSLQEALRRPISPATARQPGYGVKPLANDSESEKQRFKADYFNAMRRKFGNDELALQAFISGPGRLSKRLKQSNPSETGETTTKSSLRNLLTNSVCSLLKPSLIFVSGFFVLNKLKNPGSTEQTGITIGITFFLYFIEVAIYGACRRYCD